MIYRASFLLVIVYLAVAWSPVSASAKPGDFIFLYGRIINCSDTARIVDIGRVEEDGYAEFLDGIRVKAEGMNHQSITEQIADGVEQRSGNRPKSLYVSVIDPTDDARLSTAVVGALASWNCDSQSPRPPGESPPFQSDFYKRLAATISPAGAIRSWL